MSVANTHYGYESIKKIMESAENVHFIGIGGISMSSLAAMTKKRGYSVTGSDRAKTNLTEKLRAMGIGVSYTHDEISVDEADVVVYTVAISADNPEFSAAQRKGIPCISRADYLGYLMMDFSMRIGISGTHGKSTTTAMCAGILVAAETDPTILCGAELPVLDNMAYSCGDDTSYVVFEACEYRDSFLDFFPNIAVVLNIELDHVDYFSNIEQMKNSFSVFADKCGDGGFVIANADDPNCMDALSDVKPQLITFGMGSEANFRAVNISEGGGFPEFDILYDGEQICHIHLPVSGLYNVLNATAAAAVSYICGIEPQYIEKGLNNFSGAHRRSEFVGEINGAEFFDDYGHHPTEIRKTLSGIRSRGHDRLICVFQPHTYSRTAGFLKELCVSFDDVDKVIFADIYAARETDTLGMSASLLAEKVGEKAMYLGDMHAIANYLKSEVRLGDAVIVMGAGDIYKLFGLLGFDYTA